MSDRVILHCDCNSFFASVETILNPEYKNVPMAVCGNAENRHGIVLAKNELAKAYGIQTTETIYSAKQKCKNLVIATPHYDKYSEFSIRANEIYSRYTDMVEKFGIDESWLDVTASQKLFGDGYTIAKRISDDIKRELGITVSIGVSFNKVFAKLGSDYKKPDAITVINREDVKKIVHPLPVSALLFVGRKTTDILNRMGVHTIGDLASLSRELLVMKFGKSGDMLYEYANGLDESPVSPVPDEAKSISMSFTFKHDLHTLEDCRVGVEYLSFEIASKLRSKGVLASTVQLVIKDENLHSIQRQCKLEPPTDISQEIAKTAYQLLIREFGQGKSIRMLAVCVSNFIPVDEYTPQLSFVDTTNDEEREKIKKIEQTADIIRQKFGKNAIIKGAIIDTDIGIYDAPDIE